MDKKKTVVLVLMLCAAVALLIMILVLRQDLNGVESQELTRLEDGTIVLTPEPAVTVPPAKTTSATSAPSQTPGIDPTVPARTKRADPSYFDDAAFVGNETVAALERYDYDGLLTGAAFYEVETVTETGYVSDIKADGGYGKIYIGLGGYELAYTVDTVRDSLASAIRSLKAEYPDCVIYLMGVSPVSKYRTSISKALRMDRLPEYTDMLYELAAETGVWYIEITGALVNEEGYLPSEVTEDGINYTPEHYQAWYDLIATRYVE